MPIEKEIKYVLDPQKPSGYMKKLRALEGVQSLEMSQGYLEGNSRIRKSLDMDTGARVNHFTYKQTVNGQTVEVECEISDHDYDLLWTKVVKIITKNRIKVPVGEYIWEVDFFTADKLDGYYLVMAEVEFPAEHDGPSSIPDFITERLVYEVPDEDKRFTNRRLAHPGTIMQLVQELKNGKR